MKPAWRSAMLRFSLGPSELVAICPASSRDRLDVFVLTREGLLRGVDLERGHVFFTAQLDFMPTAPGAEGGITLAASDDGLFVAATQTHGLRGALFDVARQTRLRELVREDYHADVSAWTLAFLRHRGQLVLVSSAEWNRLEALAVPSLEPLVPAEATLNYFFGSASLSPSGAWLASSGWAWHPLGMVRIIDVAAWLDGRPADPPEREGLGLTAEWWDDDLCWLSDDRLVVRGEAQPDADHASLYFEKCDGLVVIDFAASRVERVIPCDARRLATDGRFVFSWGSRVDVYEPGTGALVTSRDGAVHEWLPGARAFISFDQGRAHAHWLSGTHAGVVTLPASAIAPDAHALAVLGDSLEAAGADPALVEHCRAAHPHGERCWVLEALRAG
ncbi:MAG: hypothetical protein U0228_39535 [Myxococcaceae bacterium]